jgi:ribosome biogenesis SPOUT family RNA methylase Rps3
MQRNYSEVIKETKKKNVIIVKSKIQKNETIKQLIKEKVKNMAIRITKLKKDSNRVVIIDCDTEEELKAVQANLGKDGKITESQQMKPKIKIVNIAENKIKRMLI